MKRAPRVLVVNDDEDALFLVTHAVTREYPEAELLTCKNGDDALALLRTQAVDAIITDNGMPGTSGVAMVRTIRANDRKTLIMMLTGAENVRNQAFEAGVNAFMTTGSWTTVRQTLRELLDPLQTE